MTPAPWLPPCPTRTTDGLISAATSAIASESASPARAGATGDVTVCSRSRVIRHVDNVRSIQPGAGARRW